MDDQHRHVKSMLTRAADAAGAFEPPPVATLTQRAGRRFQSRSMYASAAAATVVLALAVAQFMIGARHEAATPPNAMSPLPAPATLSLPGPTGPAVSVSALRGYRWSALPMAPITERGDAASAWTGKVLIVWGGQTSDNRFRNDGAAYDPTSHTWTRLPESPLSGRVGALSAWVNDSFIVWGGYDDGNGHHATDGARYDLGSGGWTKLPPAPISSYSWAQLVVAQDQAVLLSASQNDQPIVRADAYDPISNSWRPMPALVVPAGHHVDDATVALGVGDTVFLWYHWFNTTWLSASTSETASGVDSYALDTKSATWFSVPLEPDGARSANQPIWTGTQVLLPDEGIYCGPCSHPADFNDPGVAIDPQTGARAPIRSGPLSIGSARFYWTGAAVLALNISTESWGGDPSMDLNPGDTAAWDPNTNSWSRLSSAPLNGTAIGTVIAWTGDRLLIWGGPDQLTGLQFSPAGS
jgi:hypothetical protein